MSVEVMIGVIKMFDRENGRGVIAPKSPGKDEKDLYFATEEKSRFRQGQLVKFSKEGSRAIDVAVLSETY